MSADYPITTLCKIIGASHSGFYKWRWQKPSARQEANDLLKQSIKSLFFSHRQVYGSPRITAGLKKEGHRCGRNRVAKLMRQLGLKGRQKKAFRPKTTNSNHNNPIAPNRLAQAQQPTRPNQIWVADITYVATQEGWLYLAAVMDLYSRKIVGWTAQPHLKTQLVQEAWNHALKDRSPAPGLLHHSDRGCQYTSSSYQQLLQKTKTLPSMSSTGNCYDNATIESFWSTLKTETLHQHNFKTQKEAQLAIFDYIETFYNRKRLHSALGYQSPVEFEMDFINENH